MKDGWLTLVEPYIPHRRASLFTFNELNLEVGGVEVSHISSGLVTHASPTLVTHRGVTPTYTPLRMMRTGNDTGSAMIKGRI